MTVPSVYASIRFGYGPGRPDAPQSAADLLAGLSGPDAMAARYPVMPGREVLRKIGLLQNRSGGLMTSGGASREADLQSARTSLRAAARSDPRMALARILDSPAPFRERLVWFWSDHFTAVSRNARYRALGPAYVDEALRPHVAGRFADMLRAVVTHPFFLQYFDQSNSVGPNSAMARGRRRRMNENLARELLELHTLSVSAAYSQTDVAQLAELLTGLGFDFENGFVFNPAAAEPGAEKVLGQIFGGPLGQLEAIDEVLEVLAARPETARHIARKLAVHFVSDTPSEALVADLADAYAGSGGDLLEVYRALLAHPEAWGPPQKVRWPMELIGSGLLSLGVTGDAFTGLDTDVQRHLFDQPLADMGQPFLGAPAPDGLPEAAEQWITPQRLAARIRWAMRVSRETADRAAPPEAVLARALGGLPAPRLEWAMGAAETRSDAVALILASAEFNSR
jgi:uncharacterized protein (DUF1800 family)